MALLKNNRGEYNYHFSWITEEGHTCGFNDVWAANKKEAVRKAKLMETAAHWAWYNGTKYVTVPEEVTTGGHCFWMKGMYVDLKSMHRASAAEADEMNRIGNMMSC